LEFPENINQERTGRLQTAVIDLEGHHPLALVGPIRIPDEFPTAIIFDCHTGRCRERVAVFGRCQNTNGDRVAVHIGSRHRGPNLAFVGIPQQDIARAGNERRGVGDSNLKRPIRGVAAGIFNMKRGHMRAAADIGTFRIVCDYPGSQVISNSIGQRRVGRDGRGKILSAIITYRSLQALEAGSPMMGLVARAGERRRL